jgi:microtubule-associated protein-like 6
VGVAAVEAALRGWLTRNRALHEPKRITLIRMLGAGLVDDDGENGAENDDSTKKEKTVLGATEDENKNKNENVKRRPTPRTPKFVNGVPLDANGRPVGVIATFPDPRYAAVDREGKPLPLEARKEFIPKFMPPAKRAYHPQAAPFGPKRRDGTWDGLEENPRDTDPRDPNECAKDKGLILKAPPLVLTQTQFKRACEKSGVGFFSDADVNELFNRRSTRPGGKVLEIEAFTDALLLAPQRSLGDGLGGFVTSAVAAARQKYGTKNGALDASDPRDYDGKIAYKPCKVGVFAPTGWDAEAERVSATLPDVRVELRWAHGCSTAGVGHLLADARTRGRPETLSDDEKENNENGNNARFAYAVGAMGVVYDCVTKQQTFFRGHDDEIVSLATHPSGLWAATGQAGRAPCVCVWDTNTGREVARLRHAPGDRGVVAVAFGPGEGAPGDADAVSASPARLVTVAADATHCVRVWDWGGRLATRNRAYELSRAPGRGGGVSSLKNPRVRGAAFAPDADAFATFGEGHVKIWTPRARDAANDTTATGARPQGGAAAAAAAAARARAMARAAALPGGASTSSLGYAAKTCGGGVYKPKALPDALCGAFAPGPGGGVAGLLVTGHADGRVRVWHGDALVCVSGENAPGAGEPVRALAVTPPAFAGATEIVAGGGDGVARRWGVFATQKHTISDSKALEIRPLGELPVPREAPPGFAGAGAVPTVRALAADAAGTVAAVTAAGDLWVAERAEKFSDADGSFDSGFRSNDVESKDSSSEGTFPVPPGFSMTCVTRGQPSAAHCVAWHPHDKRGVFAVAGGGARVCVYAAETRTCIAFVWAADPTPARVTCAAFAPDPSLEAFPEAEDTDERGGMMLALGTADGQVRLVRLRMSDEKTKTKTYVARTVAAVTSSEKRFAISVLRFSPDGARLLVAADKELFVHEVVGAAAAAVHDRVETDEVVLDGDISATLSNAGKRVHTVRWLPSRVACRGHRGAIVSADWSTDGLIVRSTCRAREILHFDARSGRQAVGDFRDAEWATWTAPLGFPVMGVFQNGGNGGDEINSVSRRDVFSSSNDGEAIAATETVVAAGDDFGRVRVFRWPCVAREAPAVEEIETHASHVSCVRFAPEEVASVPGSDNNDRWLVSTGGGDRAVVQWAVVQTTPKNDFAFLRDETDAKATGSEGDQTRDDPLYRDPLSVSVDARGAPSRDSPSFPDAEDPEAETATAGAPSKDEEDGKPNKKPIGAYRRDALAALETRVSSLLSAARPQPPARRVRPWTKKPSIEVRARDAGKIKLGPRRPDTPPDTGEVLEYVDGEYVWAEPKKVHRPS